MAKKTDTMSSEAVIAAIQKRRKDKKLLALIFVEREDPELARSAILNFKKWNKAIEAAGFTMQEVVTKSQKHF